MTAKWTPSQLGHVGKWLSGGTPSLEAREYWGGSMPWVSPKDMKRFELWDTEDHITEKGLEKGSRAVEAGDLLIVVRGMILAHTFPVAVAMKRMAFNQDIKAIRCHPHVDSRFLAHWLVGASARILTKVTDTSHGTKRFDVRQLQRHPLLLPPHDEQKAIARIIDAVDVAIGKAQAAIEIARKLKRGLLQALFDRQTELPVKLSSHITEIQYGTSQASNDKKWGYPTLRIPNIIGGSISEEDITYVDSAAREMQRYLLKTGDLLLVRTNGNPNYIGRSAVFEPSDEREWLYASYLIRVRFDSSLLPRYVDEYLKSGRGRRELFRRVTTSAGNYNINTKSIRAISIHVPDRDQQVKIVQAADAANCRLAGLEREKAILERLKRGLMQDLLTGRVRVKLPAASGNGVVRSRP